MNRPKKRLEPCRRRPQALDIVGTAEAAMLLGVERPRIGRWRRYGIAVDGGRIPFPEPIPVAQTASPTANPLGAGWHRLSATPLWWGDDIRALAPRLRRRARRRT